MFSAVANFFAALADLTVELRRSRKHLAQVNDLADGILVQTPEQTTPALEHDAEADAVDAVAGRNGKAKRLVRA